MPPSQRPLALFPLNVVLFPGATLPLHVFEERYRLMMTDCLQGDRTFGVALIREGAEVGEPALPYSTGTVAEIQQVQVASGGRLHLLVRGRRRFRILEITRLRPYVAAQVELLEEGEESPSPEDLALLRRMALQYVRLTAGLQGGWVREVPVPRDPVALSYFVAAALQVSLVRKQRLLEEPTARHRLEAEITLLAREIGRLRCRVAQHFLGQNLPLQ